MMHYFTVAFGHGKDALLTAPPQQAASALRSLLDAACSATFGRFPVDVLTAVAPGGVMLAFPDGNPARVEQLCESMVDQLTYAHATQGAAHRREHPWDDAGSHFAPARTTAHGKDEHP